MRGLAIMAVAGSAYWLMGRDTDIVRIVTAFLVPLVFFALHESDKLSDRVRELERRARGPRP